MLSSVWVRAAGIMVCIGVVTICAAFLLREYRFADSWRICSAGGAYQFDYINRQMIFDDYVVADQKFEMRPCSANIPIKDCSMSIVTFVNPLRAIPSDSSSYSLKRGANGETIAVLDREVNRDYPRTKTVTYDKSGKFYSMSIVEPGGAVVEFRQCDFPLFR